MSSNALDILIGRHGSEMPRVKRILASTLAIAEANQNTIFVPAVAKLAGEDNGTVRNILGELSDLAVVTRKFRVRCPNTFDGICEFDVKPSLPIEVECTQHPLCPDTTHIFSDPGEVEIFYVISTDDAKKNFNNMLHHLIGKLAMSGGH